MDYSFTLCPDQLAVLFVSNREVAKGSITNHNMTEGFFSLHFFFSVFYFNFYSSAVINANMDTLANG